MLSYPIFAQRPNVTPVTPTSASLFKSLDFSMSMTSGVPNISIPLYSIDVGGLEIPIDLSYQAGGIKINERSGRYGLGWSLSCDLQITRSINGIDDFGPGGYFNNNLITGFLGYTYPGYPLPPHDNTTAGHLNAYKIGTGQVDGQPDRFAYKLANKSGAFYFLKNGPSYRIVPVPFSNIKIVFDNGQFVITDTDGTTYYYGQQGAVDESYLTTMGKEISKGNVVTWKCLRITAPNGADDVYFTYETEDPQQVISYSDRFDLFTNDDPCQVRPYYTAISPDVTVHTTLPALLNNIPFYKLSTPKYRSVTAGTALNSKDSFHILYWNGMNVLSKKALVDQDNSSVTMSGLVKGLSIKDITFRGGKVAFSGTSEKLSSLSIYDETQTLVRSVGLYHSHVDEDNVRTNYLDSVHIGLGSNVEKYAFLYNSKMSFGGHLKGNDSWGYRNNNTVNAIWGHNQNTIPFTLTQRDRFYYDTDPFSGCTQFYPDVEFGFGNDDYMVDYPDEQAMLQGVLKRIIYPTGGFVDFAFEANKYLETFNGNLHASDLPLLGGGLRVKSISYFNPENTVPETQRIFKYGELEDGTGIAKLKPKFVEEPYKYYFAPEKEKSSVYYLRAPFTDPILYPLGCLNRNCLEVITIEDKTTFHPSSSLNYWSADGPPVYYTAVTEYKHDYGRQSGKTVHKFFSPDDFYVGGPQAHFMTERVIEGTNIPRLKAEGLYGAEKMVEQYSYNLSTKKYLLKNRKSFTYTPYVQNEQVRVVYAYQKVAYQVVEGNYSGGEQELYNHALGFAGSSAPSEEFTSGDYGVPVLKLLLQTEKEEVLDEISNLTIEKEYEYASLPYISPTTITTKNSKGLL
ncbi:hypothetical protein [Niabella hibiscisoli]|uniref:hypothetical protein n=1 Tax=Niabella hibiscisoli TaxID=1825928 RepID=UPI001F0DBF78|nr:hypothetical protein [Niabella hibiscisoli]MCH5718255.1 hypothetical protein [Niabella hibiscisoli]